MSRLHGGREMDGCGMRLIVVLVVAAAFSAAVVGEVAAKDKDKKAPKIQVELLVIEALATGKPYADPKLKGMASNLPKVLKFKRYKLWKKPNKQKVRIGETKTFKLPNPFYSEIKILSKDAKKGTNTLQFTLFLKLTAAQKKALAKLKKPTKPKVVVKTKIVKKPGSPAFILCPKLGEVTYILAITVK